MQNKTMQLLPVAKIVSTTQVRKTFDFDSLDDLAQSVREIGIQQPIHVRLQDDRYVILIGERRWRAAKLAGLTTVPAIVVDEPMTESDILQAQLIENIHRENLPIFDQARAVAQLIESKNCTAAEAAKLVGKSPATVSKLLSLLTLPPDTQAQVASGDIGLAAGHALARNASSATDSASKPARKQKQTIALNREQSISTAGIDSTIDAVIRAFTVALARLKVAQKQGFELPTTLAMFRDQAGL